MTVLFGTPNDDTISDPRLDGRGDARREGSAGRARSEARLTFRRTGSGRGRLTSRMVGLACWAVGAVGLSSCASEPPPGTAASAPRGGPLYCETGPTSVRPGIVYKMAMTHCMPGDATISEQEFNAKQRLTHCLEDRRQIYYQRSDAACETGDRTITTTEFRRRPPLGLDPECPVFAGVPEPFLDKHGFAQESGARSSFSRFHRLDHDAALGYNCICRAEFLFEMSTGEIPELNKGVQAGLQAAGLITSQISTKPGTISRWESEVDVTYPQIGNFPGRIRAYFGDTSCLATAMSVASEDAGRRHRLAIDTFFGSVRRFAKLPAELAQGGYADD